MSLDSEEFESDAEYFAWGYHRKQIDDDGKSHFEHVKQVVNILKTLTDNKTIINAGWLHDILEDTNVTYDELAQRFGVKVANIVKEVTKTGYNNFPNLHSHEAVILKFADRLQNLSRMACWPKEKQDKYILKSKFWKSEASLGGKSK
jgi:GTP diphosphokinase / guanosine-3',5'-bis(diphosphate) 3'-diphosphatase